LYSHACVIEYKNNELIIFSALNIDVANSFNFIKNIGFYTIGYEHLYSIRYKTVIINGVYMIGGPSVGISKPDQLPNNVAFLQNYPNPFNPSTKISFSIPTRGYVKLIVYDLLGKEVKTLLSEERNPGSYEVNFDAAGLSSGTYVYRLQVNNFVDSKKMFLLK